MYFSVPFLDAYLRELTLKSEIAMLLVRRMGLLIFGLEGGEKNVLIRWANDFFASS